METYSSTHIVSPVSTNRHRTLIICFDGTSKKISTKLSNVAQFFSLLKKDMPSHQLVYYQTGIGTYTSSNVVDPVSSKIVKTWDLLFATSITSRIKDGYDFIMQHYLDGDKICIFGFSRGAYTARALAGMIHKVSLIPRGNTRHITYAYKVFLKMDWKKAAEFKRCFCMPDVSIEFVGIWDSVGSIGLNGPGLPFSKASTTIKTFRHALSLDERRVLFHANVWRCPEDIHSKDPIVTSVASPVNSTNVSHFIQDKPKFHSLTDVLEVWFSGCHSDVGGGSVETDTSNSLSRIPLRWMVLKCFRTGTGILFSVPALHKIGLEINPEPEYIPPGAHSKGVLIVEEGADSKDILSPMHDKLKSVSPWWILEVMPLRRWFRNSDVRTASSKFTFNLGRTRFESSQEIKGSKVLVHRSVGVRIESKELRYRPNAILLANHDTRVDGDYYWLHTVPESILCPC